jgi:hypothetical protein
MTLTAMFTIKLDSAGHPDRYSYVHYTVKVKCLAISDKIRSKFILLYSPITSSCESKYNIFKGEGVFQNLQLYEANKVWTVFVLSDSTKHNHDLLKLHR